MGRRMIANFAKHPAFKVSSVWDPSSKSLTATKEEFQDIHYSGRATYKQVKPDLSTSHAPEFLRNMLYKQ